MAAMACEPGDGPVLRIACCTFLEVLRISLAISSWIHRGELPVPMSLPLLSASRHVPASGLALETEVRLAAKNSAQRARRDYIWELPSSLHCSVVGTCLTTGDLRRLFGKLSQPDARTASDHTLHARAVAATGQKDLAGKLLNKVLDRRHEAHIKRFAKAKTMEDVRSLWRAALERGEIPGAYWATLSHPATNRELVQEAFGDVHMLSHLVGMSNRADIARLRSLERELDERDDKIGRQELRLQQSATEKADLNARVERLEGELRLRPIAAVRELPATAYEEARILAQKLSDEQARSAALVARTEEQGRALKASAERIEQCEAEVLALRAELAALEETVAASAADETASPIVELRGLTVLYVGGRRGSSTSSAH